VLAKGRGPDFDKELQRVGDAAKPDARPVEGQPRLAARLWAAFVLSGPGD
jgi:hypothetical protein